MSSIDFPCHVSVAPTSRAACNSCNSAIATGSLRIGRQYDANHSGQRFYHPRCFPKRYIKLTPPSTSYSDFFFGWEKLTSKQQSDLEAALNGTATPAKKGIKPPSAQPKSLSGIKVVRKKPGPSKWLEYDSESNSDSPSDSDSDSDSDFESEVRDLRWDVKVSKKKPVARAAEQSILKTKSKAIPAKPAQFPTQAFSSSSSLPVVPAAIRNNPAAQAAIASALEVFQFDNDLAEFQHTMALLQELY